jgi:hypothetical protein
MLTQAILIARGLGLMLNNRANIGPLRKDRSKMEKLKKQTALERYLSAAMLGGGAGALFSGMAGASPKGMLAKGLMGATLGGGGTALGDVLMGGEPEDRWSAAGHGALGAAALGAPIGAIAVGAKKGGGALLKHLMQRGMSKNKAAALLLGSAGAGGALGGAMEGAWTGSAALQTDEDRRRMEEDMKRALAKYEEKQRG